MPRGRKPNLDKKIGNLISSLKRTLVAKKAAEIASSVAKHVDAFVHGLTGSTEVEDAAPAQAAPTTGKRKFSAATRAKMKRSQKARWAKSGKGRNSARRAKAPAKTASKGHRPAAPSAGRARQIAAMKKYWATRRKAGSAKTSKKTSANQARKANRADRSNAGGAWAAMTPEQRAARIAKMRAGRSVKPEAKQ